MLSKDQARKVHELLNFIESRAKTRTYTYDGRIYERVEVIQQKLDAIKDLLQPEPEGLASAVLGLITKLADARKVALSYLRLATKHKQELDAVTQSNGYLRKLLQEKKDLLENSKHALRHVRDQLETILEQTEP